MASNFLDEVGHHVQEMQEKSMRTRPTLTPIWIKEWPALIAKSHKGDTDAFVVCRYDFSVSSGVSKTYSVTSLIVKICTEHRADLAQDRSDSNLPEMNLAK